MGEEEVVDSMSNYFDYLYDHSLDDVPISIYQPHILAPDVSPDMLVRHFLDTPPFKACSEDLVVNEVLHAVASYRHGVPDQAMVAVPYPKEVMGPTALNLPLLQTDGASRCAGHTCRICFIRHVWKPGGDMPGASSLWRFVGCGVARLNLGLGACAPAWRIGISCGGR